MKNTMFILVAFLLFSIPAFSLVVSDGNKIKMEVKDLSIKEVLEEIKSGSNFSIWINSSEIDLNRKVTFSLTGKSITEILDKLFEGQDVTYEINEKFITVYKNKAGGRIGEAKQPDRRRVVTGTVLDVTGETLIGVNIVQKGTKNGTVSNLDGDFSIELLEEGAQTLTFSLLGYKKQEVAVKSPTLRVILAEDVQMLEELVVIGYGVQKKVEITGSVSAIQADELTKVTTANMTNALQGKVPGLNIRLKTSEPGDYNSDINIRGLGSALVIVDGIPRADFQRLDPNEIESISVLKDASAAIYGMRAANGVILVTTKKGKTGKAEITFNATTGFQTITDFPKAANAYGYMDLYNEAMANQGATSPTYDHSLIQSGSPYANNSWFDEVMRDRAPQTQINFTASGGNDKITYFNSIGYFKEEGLWSAKSLRYERYNLRSNVSAKITNGLTTDFQIGGYTDNKNGPAYDAWEIMKGIAQSLPIYEVYANGNRDYLGKQYNDDANPLIKSSKQYGGYRDEKNTQIQVSAALTWEVPFLKGLTAKALVAYDPKFHFKKQLRKKYTTYTYDKENDAYRVGTESVLSSVNEWRKEDSNLTSQLSLNYTNSYKNHNFKGLVLFETKKWTLTDISGGRNTLMDAVDQIYAGLVDDARSINGSADRDAIAGLVGRLDYDYLSKYLLQASFRYDGSSKFYNKQWGFFPSISLGWRISEEAFIQDNLSFVTNLKLRGSIGKMGDDAASDSYLWLPAYQYPGDDKYVLGSGGLIPGVGMPEIPNVAAGWYTSTMKNIGIEADLWNGGLTLEFDLFRRDRDGLFAHRLIDVPSTFGSKIAKENLNSDRQQGFEFVIGRREKIGDFYYSISGNVTYTLGQDRYVETVTPGNSYDNWINNKNNRNKGIKWTTESVRQYQSMNDIYTNPIRNGKYYEYTYLPGDYMFVDFNEDGIIDDWDKQPLLRDNTPKLNFALNLSGEWKGIDLAMLLQGAAMYSARVSAEPLAWGGNSWEVFEDRWHKVNAAGEFDPFDPEGTWVPGRYPSTRITAPHNFGFEHSGRYFPCRYIRLKNIELGYSLPSSIVSKAGMRKVRIFVNGYNLLTFKTSDMKLIDPETPDGDVALYPLVKNVNFGVNVTF